MQQTKNPKRLTIEIDPELHTEVKYRAYKEGKTITVKILELLKKWLGKD